MHLKGKTVVFCIPGSNFHITFMNSWNELLMWCNVYGIRPIFSLRAGANLYNVRNSCLNGDLRKGVIQKPFDEKIKYDYLMWIDSDIVFSPRHFVELINVDQPIVSGLYKRQDGSTYATVEKMDDEYLKKNGMYHFLTEQELNEKKEPFKVDYTGFGWMLIKHGVFESLEYPWFSPAWLYNKTADDISMNMFTTEDIGFCLRAKEIGYDIWAAPKAVVGHLKPMILL